MLMLVNHRDEIFLNLMPPISNVSYSFLEETSVSLLTVQLKGFVA